METAELAVIMVGYNCSDVLAAHIPNASWNPSAFPVIVVDNSDDDAEAAATRALCERQGWHYMHSGGNIGFGAASNIGAETAFAMGARGILLLNPDAWLDEPTIRALAAASAVHEDAALSPLILRPDGRVWFSGGTMDLNLGAATNKAAKGRDGDWISTAVLAVPQQLWRRVGGFDPRYFLYWEDVDLTWRMRQAGGRLRVLENLTAFHDVGGTQETGKKSALYVYYNCRNRLMFAADHMTRQQRLRWLLHTPDVMRDMFVRGGKTRKAFQAAIRGTAAGLWYWVSPGKRRSGRPVTATAPVSPEARQAIEQRTS